MLGFCSNAINELVSVLEKYYVFPDVAANISKNLAMAVSAGKYDDISVPRDLAGTLSTELLDLSHDPHLRVRFNPGEMEPSDDDVEIKLTPEILEQMRQDMEVNNFGFHKLERLPGNIGYIDLRTFLPPEIAGETAVATMNFVANTYALVFDLRRNHGGFPSMVNLISGYLFLPSVHLNSVHWRKNEKVEQNWSLPYVPGKHYGSRPVYVLTSKETFSAAESFVHALQSHRRATIVGERTKGGANPTVLVRLTPEFDVSVPIGRIVDPITKTNWDWVGIEPDIETLADDALQCAYEMALTYVSGMTSYAATIRKEAQQALDSKAYSNL